MTIINLNVQRIISKPKFKVSQITTNYAVIKVEINN